jgi:ferric-dicitrate binding protein FerR (iron transport regulator)
MDTRRGSVYAVLVVLFILAAGGSPLFALDGTLTYFTGSVTVERDGAMHQGAIGMAIHEGDVVRTEAQSTAVITLKNNADIKLRADTALDMAILGEEVKVRLLRGSIFSRVRKKLFKSYGVEAETVLAGVRGTEFFIAYGRTIEATPDIWLCVNEGSVDVTVSETGKSSVVREGEGINIVGGSKLTKPRRYAWTRDLNWNTDPSRGSVQDATDLDQAYSDLLDQDYD